VNLSRLIITTFFLAFVVLLLTTKLPFLLVLTVSCFTAAATGRVGARIQDRRDVER
jgi:hypothetical protein